MTELSIVYRPPGALKARARNPRAHTKRQLEQLARSIREFGFVSPVLVDRQDIIIAGHARVLVAQDEGLASIPTVMVDHLTPAQIRAYVIADNKIAENAGWDPELLRLELEELEALDFDIGVLAFETGELDVLLAAGVDEADDGPAELEPGAAVSRRGDVWQIATHRLACGDATSDSDLARLVGDEKARSVFIDPPYNVPIDGHVCGLGKVRHREFAMASGEMSEEAYIAFLTQVFKNLVVHTALGSIHFVCMDWRHMVELMTAGRQAYSELKNVCVWVKPNGGMGSLYRSRHELVFVFKNGSAPHLNNVELGKHGRYRTNVWEYPGISGFGRERSESLALHPTAKPVAMVADAIMDCSERGELVLDVFAGSGTTLLAAERSGRRCYAMELDPLYVDAALRRFTRVFGVKAILTGSGKTFDEVEAERTAARDIVVG